MAMLQSRSCSLRACAQPRIAHPRIASRRVVARSSAEAATVVKQETAVHMLSGESFEEFLSSNETVIVDYYTDWCGPCKMIAPHYEQFAQELPNIKFAKLNCTTEAAAKKIAMAQGVKALPTFHVFKRSERVGVFVGGKPAQLRKFIDEHHSS